MSHRSLYHYYAEKGVVSMHLKVIYQLYAVFEQIPQRHSPLAKSKINHNKLAKVLIPCQSIDPSLGW